MVYLYNESNQRFPPPYASDFCAVRQQSVFRSEKCRHRVKPAIFCRGRFQFLDENSACFSHRCSGGHQHSFTLAELFCTKIWDKRKPLGCAADLDIHRPTDNLLTKTKFSSRGIGGGSAGWHLYTRLPSQFLDENRHCFRYGGQRGCGSESACGTRLAVRSLVVFHTLLTCSIDELSHLWSEWLLGSTGMPLPLLREYVRWHIYMTITLTAHWVQYACHFSMQTLAVLWIWLTLILKMTPPTLLSIWKSSFGFLIDLFLIFCGRFLIDMTPTHFRIGMIMTKFFSIEMTELSYRNDHDLVLIWGEGKGIFYPLLPINPKVIFLVIGTGKFEDHFGHRKYSQWDSKTAPKNSQSFIISIGQTICKENIIEVNLERIIPPEKDSRRTYYRFEQYFSWIWTVLSTIFNDFNNKSIRGNRCFKNVQTPKNRPFVPLHAFKWDVPFGSIGDIPYSPDFCFIWDIPYNFIGDTYDCLLGISPIINNGIPDRCPR